MILVYNSGRCGGKPGRALISQSKTYAISHKGSLLLGGNFWKAMRALCLWTEKLSSGAVEQNSLGRIEKKAFTLKGQLATEENTVTYKSIPFLPFSLAPKVFSVTKL